MINANDQDGFERAKEDQKENPPLEFKSFRDFEKV